MKKTALCTLLISLFLFSACAPRRSTPSSPENNKPVNTSGEQGESEDGKVDPLENEETNVPTVLPEEDEPMTLEEVNETFLSLPQEEKVEELAELSAELICFAQRVVTEMESVDTSDIEAIEKKGAQFKRESDRIVQGAGFGSNREAEAAFLAVEDQEAFILKIQEKVEAKCEVEEGVVEGFMKDWEEEGEESEDNDGAVKSL